MNEACSYGEEQLVGLLYEDGDADPAELRAHLATCPDCRAELERLTSMKELLGAWPNVANAPRMVYVNEAPGFLAGLRRWAGDTAAPTARAVLKPAVAAVTLVLMVALATTLLEVRVADDGRLRIGLGTGPVADAPSAPGIEATGIDRDEFRDGLMQVVTYMEELLESRSEDERRRLIAALDERMAQQGEAMSRELRGFVSATLTDMERQHENDLGLVFSAIDELGLMTASELQRMNTILASLMQRAPEEE